jgi:hypothetical protein
MFKNSYQSGFLSILYAIGSKPLQLWDCKGEICTLGQPASPPFTFGCAEGRAHRNPFGPDPPFMNASHELINDTTTLYYYTIIPNIKLNYTNHCINIPSRQPRTAE